MSELSIINDIGHMVSIPLAEPTHTPTSLPPQQFAIDKKVIQELMANDSPNIPFDALAIKNLEDIYGEFSRQICFKTGCILGHLRPDYLNTAIEVIGEEKAIELLQRENIRNCAPHWLKTDHIALDQLQELDPYGYFIYAAGFVLSQHSPMNVVRHRNYYKLDGDKKLEAFAEAKSAEWLWTCEKAKARELAEQLIDRKTLIVINDLMRRWLCVIISYDLPNKYSFGRLLNLTDTEDIQGEILPSAVANIDTFEHLIKHNFKQVTGQDIYNVDLAEIKKRLIGYSNFNKQIKPRNTKAKSLTGFYDKLFADNDINEFSARAQAANASKIKPGYAATKPFGVAIKQKD